METRSLSQSRRTWLRAERLLQLVLIAVMLLVVAIPAGGAYARQSLLEKYPAPGQMVDVGGFKLHLYCTGEGTSLPTVILVSGLDDFSIAWSRVQPEIAKSGRVCSYDRAGLGWSEASPNPRTSENMVQELHTLLLNGNVKGPYVLVGHSFGGALAELYTHNYPDEVAGLVLVDAAPADLFERIPAWRGAIEQKLRMYRLLRRLSASGLFALAPNNIPNRGFPEEALGQYRAISAATDYYKTAVAENEMFEKNLVEIGGARTADFGSLPLVVLRRGTWDAMPGFSEAESQEAQRAWNEMQAELLQLSSNSRLVVAEQSEHFIQLQQPQLVIDAVRQVLAELDLRAGSNS